MCSIFVASWTGVIKYHGPKPSRRAKQVGDLILAIALFGKANVGTT
jgi:hypothetical protein